MNILTVLGSPRKNGNTAALLEQYMKGIREKNPNAKHNHISLDEKRVRGCRGCWACQRGATDFCVTKDDMIDLYQMLIDADVIVIATPIYVFSMTAQMKTFVDRMFAVSGKLHGKKLVTLAVHGDTIPKRSGVENFISIMSSLSSYIGMEYVQNYGASSGMKPVEQNQQVLQEVYTLGNTLQEGR